MGVSLSASLSTWPILARSLGEVPLAGLGLNLVVTPLFSALLFPVLVAGAGIAAVCEPVGFWLMESSTESMLAVAGLMEPVAQHPAATVTTGVVPVWAAAILALGVVLAITGWRSPRRLCVAIGALVVGLSPAWWGNLPPAGGMRVHFLPVGQGDATLVEFADGRTLLVDGGGSGLGRDPGRQIVVPYLRRRGVDRLDWVLVTHADIDHLGGLRAVVEEMPPTHFIFDGRDRSRALRGLRERARRLGTRLHPVDDGKRLMLGPQQLEILRPSPQSPGGRNDHSLVARITAGKAAVFLAGDVEDAGERWLVRHHRIAATVLKVPHHGSRTSSTPAFVEAVDPVVAVVSAGRFNRFGHPHRRVTQRYQARGVRLMGTPTNGLVVVEIDAEARVRVRPTRP